MRFLISAYDKMNKEAVAEDIGDGDLTTQALFPGKVKARGKLIANEEGVLAGLPIFRRVFELVDKNINFEARATDGMTLTSGQLVARVSGPAGSVLQAERTALNFLQHLSGIASQTARFANAVKGTKTRILDTRKTTPSLRFLEKYAVEAGGGLTQLKNLSDRLIVTESHLALSDGVPNIVRQLRRPPMPAASVQHLAGVAVSPVQVEIGHAEVHGMPQEAGVGPQMDDLDAAAHLLNRPPCPVLRGNLERVVDDRVDRSQRSG